MSKEELARKQLATNRRWSDGLQLVAGLLLAFRAIHCLEFSGTKEEGYVVVGLVNGYVLGLLLWMAYVGQNDFKGDFVIPNRIPCLVIVACLVVATVCAFGSLYVEDKGVFTSSTPSQQLVHKGDAVYFSTITLATVGYGDFAPLKHSARNLAVWEVATGLLLLVGIVPLLISRLAGFPRD